MKLLCLTHHLFYTGGECPLCRQERSERYAQRFGGYTEEKPKHKEKEQEITEDDLNKLISKFNKKK